MPQDNSAVVATQLEKVRTKLPVLFEREDKFFSKIEKRDVEKISSRDMRAPLELRTGGDFAAFDPDGGDLGRGDGPTYDKALINTVNMRFACEWTAKSDWATDDSRKAVLQTFKRLLATSMAEFRRQIDSQCMTDGTGVLGTISAISTTAGVDTLTLNTDGFGARLLRPGQRINVYDSTLATNRTTNNERKISYHDGAGKQVKIPSVSGITVGDKIVVAGVSATPASWLQGVPYHHNSSSTGTWLGFTRSTTPEIRANRVNAGGPLALPFARLAMNKVGDRVGEDNMKKAEAWMHPCQKAAYEELGQLVSIINKGAKEDALNLYFGDNMQLAGAPVNTHYSWDKTRIDFIVPEVWGRAEMHPVDFYTDKNGNRFFEIRGSSGGVATSNVFYIVASFNTWVMNPAVCAYIDGLAVPSGY